MKKNEKTIIYVWLISLICIITTGVILCLQRPSKEIVDSNKNLLETVEKIRSHYRNRPDYWGLNTQEVVKQKLYAGTMNNNEIYNNLGKPIMIGSDADGNLVMPGQHSFAVTYKDLNNEECVDLASFRWTEEEKLGLISLSVQNEGNTYEFSWGNKGLPLTKSKAKKYCKEKNNIMWMFE